MMAVGNHRFLAVLLAGFAASIAQVLILRELLVLFLGNELSTGLVFTCWLLWTALGSALGGKTASRISTHTGVLAGFLVFLSLSLPITLLWIRASRIIWSIPGGEMVQPGTMLGITLSSTFLYCTVSGSVFALAWMLTVEESGREKGDATVIYLGEAAGAALGGCVFYFLLLPSLSPVAASWTVSLILLVGAAWICRNRWRTGRKNVFAASAIVATALCLCGGFLFMEDLKEATHRWQWGQGVVTVRDTPFHNLALLRNEEQLSLFANGQWLFSIPDLQTVEFAVHPALLHHPDPRRVLLIGGGVSGQVREILKHPMIQQVDYIEPDPEIIRLALHFGIFTHPTVASDTRLRIFSKDAGTFARSTQESYDVILSNMGDPLNADMNRFFTREFFESMKKLLRPGGLFTFAVSSSPDVVGVIQARFLKSLQITAKSVFFHVLVYPGESARFIASDDPDIVHVDPLELSERLVERDLQLTYIQEYAIFDRFSAMRVASLASVLDGVEGASIPVNQDFEPTCYFNGLAMWSAQAHPLLEKALSASIRFKGFWFWASILSVISILLGFFRIGSHKPGLAVAICVTVVGAVLMVLEVLLLVAFQILEGFVYRELALLIALFMSGLALGSALSRRVEGRVSIREKDNRWALHDDEGNQVPERLYGEIQRGVGQLIRVQFFLGFFLFLVMGILLFVHQCRGVGGIPDLPVNGIFAAMALAAGILGGMHFACAVRAMECLKPQGEKSGPTLYALDLMGAATGAFLASLYLLPVHGIVGTLMALGLITIGSTMTLLPKSCR